MFFCYGFHQLFTLFAIVFVKVQCDPTSAETVFTSSIRTTTEITVDDLSSFDMSYFCKFQAVTRACDDRKKSHKYFFDMKLQRCVQFEYKQCRYSFNMFDGKRRCLAECRDAVHDPVSTNVTFNVFCRYQPDFGDCNSYHPMWYYDVSLGKCSGFAYSGCGGNLNRFATSLECLDTCGILMTNNNYAL